MAKERPHERFQRRNLYENRPNSPIDIIEFIYNFQQKKINELKLVVLKDFSKNSFYFSDPAFILFFNFQKF